jgi:hypothetical protein
MGYSTKMVYFTYYLRPEWISRIMSCCQGPTAKPIGSARAYDQSLLTEIAISSQTASRNSIFHVVANDTVH